MPNSVVIIGDSPIPDRPSRDLIIYARDSGLNAMYVPISRISVKVDKDGPLTVIRDSRLRLMESSLEVSGFSLTLRPYSGG
ncbi:hypothetical protein [Vulcanisaeta distributa]|uniref:hypothetical protein n=1 Tax=Vulcanisaeta distributa TaxID=164451 RepID=UPI000A73D4E8|nr:hypothetical protein [Vulcanisaeta distributa]